jgi:hypothetical protein
VKKATSIVTPDFHQKVTLDLFCQFSDGELELKGQELSAAVIKFDEIVDEKTAAMKQFKERIDQASADVRKLSRKVRDRGEIRPVECAVAFHKPTKGQKTIVRFDSGEVVKECVMTDRELQEQLFPEARQ